MKRKPSALLALILLLMTTGVVLWFNRPPSDFSPGTGGATTMVVVSQGESGSAIAQKMANLGVVKSQSYLYQYLIAHPTSQSITPGSHLVQKHLDSPTALAQMLDRTRVQGLINVIDGMTVSDVTRLLNGDKQLLGQVDALGITPPLANARKSLEGELAPGSYYFAPQSLRSSALVKMVSNFDRQVKPLLAGYHDLTAYQVLTVASLLVIEGAPGNYDKVARVIYNRLHIGMPLQLNSTVQYVANLRGQIALSEAATKLNSKFNTYQNLGLPPTPIGIVSARAIAAALAPASGNWLYFITVAPGDTRFTNSYNQFGSWKQIYEKNLAAGAFK